VGDSPEVTEAAQQGRISGLAAPDAEARLEKLEQLVAALTAGEATEKITYIDYIAQLNILT